MGSWEGEIPSRTRQTSLRAEDTRVARYGFVPDKSHSKSYHKTVIFLLPDFLTNLFSYFLSGGSRILICIVYVRRI